MKSTIRFDYTGAEQVWKVPSNCIEVVIKAYGAAGGGSSGGKGGYASAKIAFKPNQILYIYVGGAGAYYTGGWNGGGYGGTGKGGEYGFGGGGATDIRVGGNTPDKRVIVAGGGGGACGVYNSAGGAGGGQVGGNGARTYIGGYNASAAGLGGGDGIGGGGGSTGTITNGGNGVSGTCNGGGGGGGGYGGGGGGGGGFCGSWLPAGGGGGGGLAIGENAVLQSGVNAGNGYLIIEYITANDRFLFQDGSEIKTVQEGNLVTLGNAPATKEMFLQGIFDLSVLTDTILSQLTTPNPQLKVWTTDPGKTFSAAKVTGDVNITYKYRVDIRTPDRELKAWSSETKERTTDSVSVPSDYFIDVNEHTITVTVEQADGQIITNTGTVSLYDTAPQIDIKMVGLGATVTITDAESDRVQYKVELNGKQIFPTYSGFSNFFIQPIKFERSFLSCEVNVNPSDFITPNNTLVVTARDEFGKESIATVQFAGLYSGLLFADEAGDYYSTDLGELLKYLDIGTLIAGQSSLIYPVKIINKNGFAVKNLVVWKGSHTLPTNVDLQISQTESPFTPSEMLVYPDELAFDDSVTMYVRIVTTRPANGSGVFEINTKADPV